MTYDKVIDEYEDSEEDAYIWKYSWSITLGTPLKDADPSAIHDVSPSYQCLFCSDELASDDK